MAIIDLANPSRFLALAERLLPWLMGLTVTAFAIGLQQTCGILEPGAAGQHCVPRGGSGQRLPQHTHLQAACILSAAISDSSTALRSVS